MAFAHAYDQKSVAKQSEHFLSRAAEPSVEAGKFPQLLSSGSSASGTDNYSLGRLLRIGCSLNSVLIFFTKYLSAIT